MNSTKNYFAIALCIFVFLTISIFTVLYAAFSDLTILSYLSVIVSFILMLSLLFVLLKTKKTIDELNEEVHRFKERESVRIRGNQQTTDDNNFHTGVFKIEEVLGRIMPADDVKFDSAEVYSEKLLQNIAKGLNIVQGLIYVFDESDQMFNISGQYAYYSEEQPKSFQIGETLSGQVAKNKETLNLKELPEGYITVLSGLGKSAPNNLIIAPIVHNENSIGVIELASFKTFSENEELIVAKICELIANRLNELRS